MKNLLQKNSILYVLLLLLLIGCKKTLTSEITSRVDTLPYFNDPSFTPKWIDIDGETLNSFHKIPNFTLVNQNGKEVSQKTFEDKIYVADFFFTTCPGICPKMTANMSILQDEFKDDDEILLLSHSVTPKIDSVPQLKKYALDKGIISDKWHLVTGDRKQIYDLGRKFYYVEENLGEPKELDEFLHTENFVLIDKQKHIRGIYNGLNKNSVSQLIADIKTLQQEK